MSNGLGLSLLLVFEVLAIVVLRGLLRDGDALIPRSESDLERAGTLEPGSRGHLLLLGFGLVDEGGWGDGDPFAGGLESVAVGAVLDHAHFSGVVDVAVLALDLAVGQLGLDLEATVGALEAVRVGAVLVVPGMKRKFGDSPLANMLSLQNYEVVTLQSS